MTIADPWLPIRPAQDWNPSQAEIDAAHDLTTASIDTPPRHDAAETRARMDALRRDIRMINRALIAVDVILLILFAMIVVFALVAVANDVLAIDLRGVL